MKITFALRCCIKLSKNVKCEVTHKQQASRKRGKSKNISNTKSKVGFQSMIMMEKVDYGAGDVCMASGAR